MGRSVFAKQQRQALRDAEFLRTESDPKHQRVSNKELALQQSYLEEKLVESEDQVPLNMSIAFQKFRPLRHSRSSFLELVEKCDTLLLRLQVSNLSHDIRIVTSDADEFHAEATMCGKNGLLWRKMQRGPLLQHLQTKVLKSLNYSASSTSTARSSSRRAE